MEMARIALSVVSASGARAGCACAWSLRRELLSSLNCVR